MDFSKYQGLELIKIYGDLIKEMKNKNLIRTKNVVGDFGEYIAIDFYSKLCYIKLQAAPTSTKNVDALSTKGDRYSIKCTTTTTTGTFWGLGKDCPLNIKPLFEYVIVVQLDENYQPLLILEVEWDVFLKHKHWHSRMNAYHLSISKPLINDSKIIYIKDSNNG